MDIRIEVEDTHLTIILPRVIGDTVVPWQEAWQLGNVILQASEEITSTLTIQSDKMSIESFLGKRVALIFYHTNRIRLSKMDCDVIGNRLKRIAQDIQFLSQGVKL